jgi:hypothetical protein
MKLIGGPGKVMLFLKEIHVPDIQVVNYEKEIGRDWETQYRTWATPNGALALLAALQSPGRARARVLCSAPRRAASIPRVFPSVSSLLGARLYCCS